MPRSKQDTFISLTPHWRQFVNKKVRSGRYGSVSEVVSEGLRLIEQHELELNVERISIRDAIEVGFDQSEQGNMIDGESVFAEIGKLSKSGRGKTTAGKRGS